MASWDDVPNAAWADDLYVEEPASKYESPSEPATDEFGRTTGTVEAWRAEKRFGFIGREDGGSDVFCHLKDIQGVSSLTVGSRVSYRYEQTAKGGSARDVRCEEAVTAVEVGPREFGTVKQWNAEKRFGFIGWSGEKDAFAHKRDVISGGDLAPGQSVSFVIEDGVKGPSAKQIQEEEGEQAPVEEEDEGERLYGTVKNINEEKGFCFIGRCDGQGDLFALKKEFQDGAEPVTGLTVSFIVESRDKGDSAKKIREEESVPEMELSDEGREFGTVVKWIEQKGFGYIARKINGEEAHVHARACNGLTLHKGMCVSFVFEENDRGPTAKDVREEDPERVARVTAVRKYGLVDCYYDPIPSKPTNGFGFIEATGPPYGGSRRHYFHMDHIATPDDKGGLYRGDYVSFIVVPARKGFQALDVKLEDHHRPEEEDEIEAKMVAMNVGDSNDA